jgi:hypothetical protein
VEDVDAEDVDAGIDAVETREGNAPALSVFQQLDKSKGTDDGVDGLFEATDVEAYADSSDEDVDPEMEWASLKWTVVWPLYHSTVLKSFRWNVQD